MQLSPPVPQPGRRPPHLYHYLTPSSPSFPSKTFRRMILYIFIYTVIYKLNW